jgi:hypothetical protein
MWTGLGVFVSAAATLLAGLLIVGSVGASDYADFAILTVILFIIGNVARLGADRTIIPEVRASVRRFGALSGAETGADVVAYSCWCLDCGYWMALFPRRLARQKGCGWRFGS